MAENEKRRKSEKELRKLREELWVILPFFIMSFYFFLGSFQYKRATTVKHPSPVSSTRSRKKSRKKPSRAT